MVSGANNRSGASVLLAQAGPEAQLAIIACDDARRSRNAAGLERARAQRDRLQLLRQGARKLGEMARNVLRSSIYQGALGTASAVASLNASLCRDDLGAAINSALAKGYEAQAKVDPFAIANRRVDHEKSRCDIEAEAASHRANQAGDDLAHARELHSSVLGTLAQIEEAKHRATLESAKV